MKLKFNGVHLPQRNASSCQVWLVMKFTTVFLLAVYLQVSAHVNAQNITYSKRDASLEDAFKAFRKQAGYEFLYNTPMIRKAKNQDLQFKHTPINLALRQVFKDQPLTFTVIGKTIVVKERAKQAKKPPIELALIDIKGRVVDSANGSPLVGVTIQTKGNSLGTTTDNNGRFNLSVPDDAVLVVSYLGYVKKEVAVNGKTEINISLASSATSLNQLVVVGYGSQKRKDLTGSVATVDSKEIQDLAVTRVGSALVGKVAGVQVQTVSGEPGAPPLIRIRGIGSISAGSNPLYVVDGVPVESIQNLNPSDIASVDILKDASATAIYGSRGANGVVIINTKRGQTGKAVISFNTYLGFQKIAKIPVYQSALEEAQAYYDGIKNRNIDEGNDISGPPTSWKQAVPITIVQLLSGQPTTEPGTTTNFQDHIAQVLQTAPEQQYQLAATGGTENIKYALSGEYLNQDGIIINTNFQRFSARANFDAKLSNKLTVKMDLNPSVTIKKNIGGPSADEVSSDGGNGSDIIYNAIQIPQYYSLLNDDGSYFPFGDGLDAVVSTQNPLALAREVQRQQKAMGFMGSVNANYAISDALKLNFLVAVDLMDIKGMYFKPNIPAFNNNPAVGDDNASMDVNWLTETTLNYTKSFGNHNLTALFGYTTQKDNFESNSLTSNLFSNNLVPTLSAVSGLLTGGSSDINQWSMISYLARVNYNFNSKYYVTASIRTDGSSRFGSDNKYGIFPSVALAWRVSGENFMKNVNFLSDLKLRASYGETGNNNIGNYEQYATINYTNYTLGGAAVGGYAPGSLANPSLTWEKQRSFNGGADIKLFKSRLSITVDGYRSINHDLLLNVNTPGTLGFSSTLQNIGEVKNTGWEVSVSTVNFDNAFQWSTDFNFSAYRNEVLKLGPSGDPIISGGNITMIGHPIGMFYGWISDGIFKNQKELDEGPIFDPGARDASRVGDVRFKDISGPDGTSDGVINSFDKTIMGSPYPDFYYGMTNRFSFKNISLSVSLQGSKGNKVLELSRNQSSNSRARFRQLSIMNDYWKSEQEPGDGWAPRPNDSPTGNWRGTYSTTWLDNASYLRINNITLAYLLPERISNKAYLSSARIYVSASNPFLITNYVGFNPDGSRGNNALTPSNSNYDYPVVKSIVFGLNLSF